MGDIRDEWRLNDIERKVNECERKSDEVHSLRGNVDSLERANRELSTTIDGFRNELEELREAVRRDLADRGVELY